MNDDLFKQFSKYEDELLAKYEKHALFTNIQSFSDQEFVNILTQYGEGISANFVKFLETALRLITSREAQEAIMNILRDEIPPKGPTHQLMRTMACEKIGITPSQLISTKLTNATISTVDAYFEILRISDNGWNNKDLVLTTFVRVIGESLVGVVYKVFTKEIVRRFKVNEHDIEFYSFHWHHDEKGGKPTDSANTGHTEYYDKAMSNLLKTDADLIEAKKIADIALNIRLKFQDQFIVR